MRQLIGLIIVGAGRIWSVMIMVHVHMNSLVNMPRYSNVLIHNIMHVSAPSVSGFNVRRFVGVRESNVFYGHISHTATHFRPIAIPAYGP